MKAKNHLKKEFYTLPQTTEQTMTLKELQETMLSTAGKVKVYNRTYHVQSKRLAPSVYLVTLK